MLSHCGSSQTDPLVLHQLIPGVNDDSESSERIAELVIGAGAQLPWHLLRFTPEYRMGSSCPTHPDKLAEAVRIAKRVGLKYVYVERALGLAREEHCLS